MNNISNPADAIPGSLVIETPWPLPDKGDCWFYHYLDLPGGETLMGQWDIRDRFNQYIGGYAVAGKTVLDVGTAGGFLAFSAERAGATVTALDCRHAIEFGRTRIPFRDALHHTALRDWLPPTGAFLRTLKNGFWYSWQKLGSKVRVSYTPIEELAFVDDRFDVVMAGAIIEHLSDPVRAIGLMARVANEAVVIAFTEAGTSDDLVMQTLNEWTNPEHDHTWWRLSRGLYKRVFENLGFETTFVPATAKRLVDGTWQEVTRYTIIARRRSSSV